MAKTKVYAPDGHHFMVNNNGEFYLMKNPSSGNYKSHTVDGEKSSLYVLLEVKEYHASSSATRVAAPTYSTPTVSRQRTSVRTAVSNRTASRSTPSSSGRSSSSGSSGSSGGGGY